MSTCGHAWLISHLQTRCITLNRTAYSAPLILLNVPPSQSPTSIIIASPRCHALLGVRVPDLAIPCSPCSSHLHQVRLSYYGFCSRAATNCHAPRRVNVSGEWPWNTWRFLNRFAALAKTCAALAPLKSVCHIGAYIQGVHTLLSKQAMRCKLWTAADFANI